MDVDHLKLLTRPLKTQNINARRRQMTNTKSRGLCRKFLLTVLRTSWKIKKSYNNYSISRLIKHAISNCDAAINRNKHLQGKNKQSLCSLNRTLTNYSWIILHFENMDLINSKMLLLAIHSLFPWLRKSPWNIYLFTCKLFSMSRFAYCWLNIPSRGLTEDAEASPHWHKDIKQVGNEEKTYLSPKFT